MNERAEVRGVIPALVTPYDEDSNVDAAAIERLVDFVVRAGVHGLMTTGGNGEFPLLSREERRLVTETAVGASGAIPVIACIASCSTEEAIQLADDAALAGAAAVILTPPYYYPLPQHTIGQHFRDVAAASPLPVWAYNNPGYTGVNMSPTLVAALAAEGVIAGLKQSNADLGQLVEILSRAPSGFPVLTGIDSQLVPALSIGASGIFSTAACAVPEMMCAIYEAALTGDLDAARSRQLALQPLNVFFEYEPGYVAPCKEALSIRGICSPRMRSPMPDLTGEERAQIREALSGLGVLAPAPL